MHPAIKSDAKTLYNEHAIGECNDTQDILRKQRPDTLKLRNKARANDCNETRNRIPECGQRVRKRKGDCRLDGEGKGGRVDGLSEQGMHWKGNKAREIRKGVHSVI